MKTISKLIAGLIFAATAATASATTTTDIVVASFGDSHIGTNIFGFSQSNTVSYTHNILNDGFVVGGTINSATLTLTLRDLLDGNEVYSFLVGSTGNSQSFTDNNFINNGTDAIRGPFTLTTSLADLKDGILNVVLMASLGNYDFVSSKLVVDFTNAGSGGGGSSTNVPEPFSLALMGLGLAGLSVMRRRAK